MYLRTRETFVDGCDISILSSNGSCLFYRWIKSGDLVKIDENEEIVVLDRLKV